MSAGLPPGGRTAVILRDYQQAAVDRLLAGTALGRALLVLPTGGGKTVVAAAVIAEVVRRGGCVVAVAHRRELVAQFSKKLHAAGVTDHGIIQAEFPMRLAEPVQVASIQSLHARTVLHKRIAVPPADLLIIDEAHRARADSYGTLIAAYPDTPIIGMTATPCRADGRGLGDVFTTMVETVTTAQLIAAKHLVPTITYAPTRPDLAGVQIARGDYVEAQLAERMDRASLVGDIVVHWHRLADRRPTVVFATGVAHSVHLRDEFRRSGVRAEHIDGATPTAERDAILAGLAGRTVEVVCNCMVLTEGWDQPEVSCLVLARPTRHMGFYRQMIGRGLRPSPDKTDCLVLDHAGAVFQHGFVEEPVEWTLDVDRRAVNPRQQARDDHRAPALSVCPQCAALHIARGPCRACGWRPLPKPVAVVSVTAGELRRVDDHDGMAAQPAAGREPDEHERVRFFRMLLWIGAEKGYARGWAPNKYRERFGHWPAEPRPIEPLEPDRITRNWVKSRVIAYARLMDQARSAGR